MNSYLGIGAQGGASDRSAGRATSQSVFWNLWCQRLEKGDPIHFFLDEVLEHLIPLGRPEQWAKHKNVEFNWNQYGVVYLHSKSVSYSLGESWSSRV